MTQKIVLASGNKGKIAELSRMLSPFAFEVVAQDQFALEDAEETGLTFVENAIIKARHAAKETGLPAIADDSGLAVDALGGAPGIYSARYAGEHGNDQANIDKLLQALENVPQNQRQARFICALVYLRHADDPTPLICQGQWHGTIATEQCGQEGFGYDPVFWLPQLSCSAAQLSKDDKNKISHRGQALTEFVSHFSKA